MALIELLVVISCLAVILSLMMPALSRARSAGVRLRCESNLRGAGFVLETYSVIHRGMLPMGPARREVVEWPGVGPISWGGRLGLRNGTWSLLLPDEWAGGRWNPALRCPRQPPFLPEGGPSLWDRYPTPAYAMTEAVWLDERGLREGVSPDHYGIKAHHAADVVYPSAKAYLLEFPTFCNILPIDLEEIELGQSIHSPAAIYFFDGSVRRYAVTEGRPGSNGTLGFLWTIDGIAGRDLP
ncbi:MAG: type II secretion system protein [Phycisphaeraceae bacterium]|nr:MAG: type II secretion system protein [Phycisphaeraceae bacterium]